MAREVRTGVASTLLRGDMRELLGRHADVALAALVVLIVAMMIVPLPTFLLDVLISLNIAVAVTLLLVSIYVSEALKIATFPTLLLLTTLFRLGIEVSATRLILLKANAGEVIYAFGNFVVAGNLVVGAVIFLILTLIQFIVISKGSERVAEVGARFTLDAMPGKQMSIDAELRAGHIDHTEARRRRTLLAREAQFFGSMDGAMKFVIGPRLSIGAFARVRQPLYARSHASFILRESSGSTSDISRTRIQWVMGEPKLSTDSSPPLARIPSSTSATTTSSPSGKIAANFLVRTRSTQSLFATTLHPGQTTTARSMMASTMGRSRALGPEYCSVR